MWANHPPARLGTCYEHKQNTNKHTLTYRALSSQTAQALSSAEIIPQSLQDEKKATGGIEAQSEVKELQLLRQKMLELEQERRRLLEKNK